MESLTAVTTIDRSVYVPIHSTICEFVALDKDSATMLHSLNGIQPNST